MEDVHLHGLAERNLVVRKADKKTHPKHMRTSFFPESPTTDTLKKDVRVLAEDTVKMARQRVMDPAVDALNRASAAARDAMHDVQSRLSRQIADAERYASRQYDRTERWVTSNPFTAVGVGLAIGIVISSLLGSSRK